MAKVLKSDADRIGEFKKEYQRWFNQLDKYHSNRFDTNYKQYTTYAATEGTETNISDPVAPELVEKVIQKLFERDPKFYVMTRGHNLPREITTLMSTVADYFWTNPDTIQSSGPMKSKLKVAGREFCILGNTGTEVYYDTKADSPSFRVIPVEDVIFNPAKTLKTSERYYVRQFVSLEYLKKKQEITEGGEVVSGLFKNIKELEREYKENNLKDSPSASIKRSGSDNYQDQVEPIELISCWENERLVQIAGWKYIIREATDPMMIGDDPLDFAMDIEVPKQPYAFSWMDFINGLTQAKDLILNQIVDYGSKLLNPPLFADPSLSSLDRATLVNAWKVGGLVMVNPKNAEHKSMPPLPSAGFDLLTYIQQRSESVSSIGGVMGGVPSETTKDVQNTATGIKALQMEAVSPVKDRQINLEESIIEPIVNKWMKMAGALMSEDEVKWIFVSGQDAKWVKITKGLLTGKATINDLMMAELINEQGFQEVSQQMMSGGLDPEKELVFDVDWIFRVETGSMAETDSEKDLNNLDSWVQFCMQTGINLDMKKIAIERAIRSGLKEPEQYMLDNPIVQGQMMPGMPPQAPQGQPQSQIPPQGQMPPQGMPPQGMPQGVPQGI